MLDEIKTQFNTLKQLGYQDFQLKKICQDAIGTTKLEQVPPGKLQYLLKVLESQVSFAYKCKQKFNG